MIKSMVLVNRENVKAVLLLIGSGPLQSNYMSLTAKLLVDLKIIGPMPNSIIFAFYNTAYIFVIPSLLEPAAVVLGEA